MICKKMSNLDFFMYKYDIWLEKSDNDEDKKIGVDFDDDFDDDEHINLEDDDY